MSISHINNNTTRLYGQMASGNRLTSAAVDPAGLAQAQRMEAQQRTQRAAANNVAYAQDASRIQDGGQANITDSLQRLHELGVQAQNGLLTATDQAALQAEADEIIAGIGDIAGNTSYNTQNLLSSNGSLAISTGNSTMGLSTANSTLASLGVTNTSLTSSTFLQDIDNALDTLSGQRATNGAQYNRFEYAYNNLSNSRENTVASLSRKSDMDMGAGMTEVKKRQVLQQYQMQMQRKKIDNMQNSSRALFS